MTAPLPLPGHVHDQAEPATTHPTAFGAFVEDNLNLLDQALTFVAHLSPEAFGRPHPELGLSSIGSHLRHILDFYLRFLDVTHTMPAQGQGHAPLLDYDLRERNVRLETDPGLALDNLRAVASRLRALSANWAGRTLLIRSDGLDSAAQHTSASSVERELQSLVGHTIHHFALIKIAASRVGVEPGREFGVAPSTLRYWEQSGACAP